MQVVIADNNEIVLMGLRSILVSDETIEIVGEARTSENLLSILKQFEADLLLIDYTSGDFSIDLIPKIKKIQDIHILAITPEQTPNTVVDALKSGVSSYVKKDCSMAEVLEGVKETSEGKKFFCGQVLESIQKAQIDINDLDLENFSCEPVLISNREIDVIKYIAEGYTNSEIAEFLHLSTHTVTTHRKNIMAKLGTKNTAGIVVYAVKTGLISPNKFLFSPSNGEKL